LIGSLRIAGTWGVLTQTYDESYHIACGVQWWHLKKYDRERQHPPLSRIALGMLPYLDGARDGGNPNPIEAGNELLGTGAQYLRTLALSRAGILPFFLLFCIAVWQWTRFRFGDAAGLGAMFIATHLPPVLGHAGLATTDMAPAATLAFMLWRWDVWLEKGGAGRAALAGIGAGLSLAAKMSCLILLPLLAGALWIFRRKLPYRWWRDLAIMGVLALLLLTSTYRFRKELVIPRAEGEKTLWTRIAGLHAFLGAYIVGISEVRQHNEEGNYSFLLGYAYRGRDWLFFPVGFLVKTPIPVLLLLAFALRYRHVWWAWTIGALALAAVMPSNINLGLRHALPMYVGVTIAAGYALAKVWEQRRWVGAALSLWLIGNAMMAHPDYLAWFNEFAGGQPERVLAESDLDWGQDLHRMVAIMDARGIAQCKLAYFGTADVGKLFPGRFKEFRWEDDSEGGCYVVSVRNLSLEAAWARANRNTPPFSWLDSVPPAAQAGKALRMFITKPKPGP
jgi:hypothetical protein